MEQLWALVLDMNLNLPIHDHVNFLGLACFLHETGIIIGISRVVQRKCDHIDKMLNGSCLAYRSSLNINSLHLTVWNFSRWFYPCPKMFTISDLGIQWERESRRVSLSTALMFAYWSFQLTGDIKEKGKERGKGQTTLL